MVQSSRSPLRLLIGIMLGAALGLIALAVWMIVTDQGAPVWVALGGSMLALAASIVSTQSKKKP
jgi:biotin transporter BioY